jgi:hypothetical protein
MEKRFWIEHYAKRNDSQWRYQRESRAYYAGNLKSIQESEAMVPVLANATELVELGARDVFPACLLGTLDVSLQGNSERNLESNLVLSAEEWSKRIGIADTYDKVPDRIPEKLANLEVSRTWRNLCRGTSPSQESFGGQSGSHPNTVGTVESARTDLVVDKHVRGEFVRTADQLELVQHLLLARSETPTAATFNFARWQGSGTRVQLPHTGSSQGLESLAWLARNQGQKITHPRDVDCQRKGLRNLGGQLGKLGIQSVGAGICPQDKRRFKGGMPSIAARFSGDLGEGCGLPPL